MLKRKQYLALHEARTETDPYTGKQKQKAVYIGPWYEFRVDDKDKRRLCIAILALGLAAAGIFIACGFINSAGSHCFYVLPFYLLLLFPLFYLCYGAIRLLRQKPRFTEVDNDEGIDRVHVSALGAAVLCGLHTVGEIVLLALGGAGDKLGLELLYALGVVALGACALVAYRLAERLTPVKLEEPKPSEPSPNPAD